MDPSQSLRGSCCRSGQNTSVSNRIRVSTAARCRLLQRLHLTDQPRRPVYSGTCDLSLAAVSRNPGYDHYFNQDERSAYRELITTLNLSEQELRDIEWAAREELKQGKPLVQLIKDTLFGTGEWPSPSLMGPEIPGL